MIAEVRHPPKKNPVSRDCAFVLDPRPVASAVSEDEVRCFDFGRRYVFKQNFKTRG